LVQNSLIRVPGDSGKELRNLIESPLDSNPDAGHTTIVLLADVRNVAARKRLLNDVAQGIGEVTVDDESVALL
jgi:hypothetical protein